MLYVAMTRAVRALHLIVAPSKANERSLPSTYAGLLRVALKDDASRAAVHDGVPKRGRRVVPQVP